MKLFLLLLFAAAMPVLSQQRYLVSSRGDAIPLMKGESSLAAATRLGLAPQSACTAQATFGYPSEKYPPDAGWYGLHNDIMGVWFVAPASGTIDSVFWFMSSNVCAPDSQLILRLFQSNTYPGHGPGYGGYPPPSTTTCWGYYQNTTDLEDGVAAFPEDAAPTPPIWVSTVTGGPGPSYPPIGTSIWGLSGVPVTTHANRVNSLDLRVIPPLPSVNIGDPFFMTLKITGSPTDGCKDGGPYTAFSTKNDTDLLHSHNWKFYENVPSVAGFTCKGWVARGGFDLFWYVMTATSNLPPTISIADQINNTTSTQAQTTSADILDCDPADNSKAGVQSAILKYSVNGGAFQSIAMANIGADRWEGTLPGEPKGSTISYRMVAQDSLGLMDSSVTATYRVVDLNSSYYVVDTLSACSPLDIKSTGTVIDTSKWFLPLHTTTAQAAHAGDDGTAGPYSLGGPFVYFGDTVNFAWIGVDGGIALSKTAAETLDVNSNGFATTTWDLPQRQYRNRADTANQQGGFMPKNSILPFWADWITKQDSPIATFGHIRYSSSAFPGKFIVEWDSVGDFDQSTSLAVTDNDRFRVILDRTAGSIQFQYDNIGIGGLDTLNLVGLNSDSLAHPGPVTPSNYYNKSAFPTETHLHNGLCVTYYPVVFSTAATDGWNMVSVGANPPSHAKAFLYPSAVSANAFGYHGSYVSTQTLANGPGYWLKFSGAQSLSTPGTPISCIDDSLDAGWNMIGSVTTPVLVSSLTTTPPGIVTSPYFGFSSSYFVASTLTPGKAYWVKSSAAGKLHICASSGAIQKEAPGIAELAGLDKLSVQDKLGRSQTLYIGSDDVLSAQAAGKYEMPPAAPDGALNVRYASQRMVEVYPSQAEAGKQYEYPVTINGAVYPLTVKWEAARGSGQKLMLLAATDKESKLLGVFGGDGAGTEKVTITDASVTKLVVKLTSGLAVPKEFALSQNYPNPFNPATHFSVDIPIASAVDVTVYDVLGRKIATLMTGEQEAGYHIMEWDSKDNHGMIVPSGMYMVRMTAGDFSAVKKIMLMK